MTDSVYLAAVNRVKRYENTGERGAGYTPLTLTKMRKDRTVGKPKNRSKYHDGKRLCYRCDDYYSVDNFSKCKKNDDGLVNECKKCNKERNRKRHLSLTPAQREAKYEANRRYRKNNIVGMSIIHMLNGVKQRCRKTGKHYEIDRPYVEQKVTIGRCEATGIRFVYERNGRGSITPFSPSLDCINPEEGYTLNNTQMVCSMYNIGKARHNETDFIAMCLAVAERNKDNKAAIQRMKELTE